MKELILIKETKNGVTKFDQKINYFKRNQEIQLRSFELCISKQIICSLMTF